MHRRRRNPSFSEVNTAITWVVLAGGGYLFYKYVLPLLKDLGKAGAAVGDAVDKGANAIAKPIADAYVYATSGAAAQVQGSVVLSTGETVTMQDISQLPGGLTPVPNSNSYSFVFNGRTYVISGPRDANGNYAATLADFGVIDNSGW